MKPYGVAQRTPAQLARTVQAHRLSPAETFLLLCKAHGVPTPATEVRFHGERMWRFDYAWVGLKVAVEQDGGIWNKGRHSRGAGILRDNEKLNTAQLMGWICGRFTPAQMASGEAVEWVKRAMEYRSER